MKQNVLIKSIEEKTSKNGRKYHSVETDKGKLTCFEASVTLELMSHKLKQVEIEIEERNGFKNITKWYGAYAIEEEQIKPTPTLKEVPILREPSGNRNQSFYVSYAKDIMVAMINQNVKESVSYKESMDYAIELVKQAEEAFK